VKTRSYLFIILNIIWLCLNSSWALPQSANEELITEELEQRLLREFKAANPSGDQQILIYSMVGQELLFYSQDEKAKSYLEKAIDAQGTEDKTQAYLDLIMLETKYRRQETALQHITELESYWKEHPKTRVKELAEIVQDLRRLNSGEDLEGLTTFLASVGISQRFTQLMKAGHYAQALSLVNNEQVGDSTIVIKTKVDLLRSLTRGRAQSELLCADTFAQYPNAYSYSMMICSILHDYQKEGTLNLETFKRLEEYFKHDHKHESYLLQMVKKLGEN
jgi:hypothetical protein